MDRDRTQKALLFLALHGPTEAPRITRGWSSPVPGDGSVGGTGDVGPAGPFWPPPPVVASAASTPLQQGLVPFHSARKCDGPAALQTSQSELSS